MQALDGSGTPADLASDYDMVLVSMGETQEGAYSNAAVLVSPCVGAVAEYEDENCDFDEVFLLDSDPQVSANSTVSHVAGASFFDDFTLAQQSYPLDIWYEHDLVPDYAISQATRVGVGTTDPQVRLHVMGDIQADTDILTDQICDDDQTGCFNPEIIAGNVAAMDCMDNSIPGIEPVLSIGNSRVYCASAVDLSGNALDGQAYEFDMSIFNAVNCAATGQLVTQIDASGTPICDTP